MKTSKILILMITLAIMAISMSTTSATNGLYVDIDIKPGSYPNSINLNSKGVITVALLGSDTFDVANVDVTTVAFGPNEVMPYKDKATIKDVDGDGIDDLVFHFKTRETGIESEDIGAYLTGVLLDGIPFAGFDYVRTVPLNGS